MNRLPLGVAALALLTAARLTVPQEMVSGGGRAVPRKALPPGLSPPAVNYVEVAASARLTGVNVSGSADAQTYVIETTGNGIALSDCNNDDLLDIIQVNGDRFNQGKTPVRHYLFKNLRSLRFQEVAEEAGLTYTDCGQGVYAGDADCDGLTDLFITYWGQNAFFRNQGNGRFRNED